MAFLLFIISTWAQKLSRHGQDENERKQEKSRTGIDSYQTWKSPRWRRGRKSGSESDRSVCTINSSRSCRGAGGCARFCTAAIDEGLRPNLHLIPSERVCSVVPQISPTGLGLDQSLTTVKPVPRISERKL